MTIPATIPSPAELELARFREEWQRELESRKAGASTAVIAGPATSQAHGEPSVPTATTISPRGGDGPANSPRVHARVALPVSSQGTSTAAFTINLDARPLLRTAVELYKQAAEAEASGSLDEALNLYRRAFRLDPDVDKAYAMVFREPTTTQRRASLSLPAPNRPRAGSVKTTDPVIVSAGPKATLSSIIQSFSTTPLVFAPEDESNGVPIEALPVEVVVLILKELARVRDYTTVERFGVVNRKARLISMESVIWREIANQLYVTPQIPEECVFRDIVEQDYGDDYRRAFVEHPRVRLDGVYISVCHYVRAGQSENAWVNVNHLITYHRYLRFLPDGRVLSLLANNDTPSEVVHALKPSYRGQGFFMGSWALSGTTVVLSDLVDPSGRIDRYGFEMVLHLKSKPTGRWNKLDLGQYTSIKLDTGDVETLPLKHERPFWFSKVKSYGSALLRSNEAE